MSDNEKNSAQARALDSSSEKPMHSRSSKRTPRRRQTRRDLQLQALVGFLGFFAAIAFAQAVVNVLSPNPKVWPAALALVLVVATASAAKAWLHSSGRS